jgi:LacI family transcriptional regulator
MKFNLRVAVLVESSRAYGRGLLEGIARYVSLYDHWSLYFQPSGTNDHPPTWLSKWKGNGIIARINDRRTADVVKSTGLPAVDLRGLFPQLGYPYVGPDCREVARMSYSHFRDRGFRNIAACMLLRDAYPGVHWCCEHLKEIAAADGRPCEVFSPQAKSRGELTWEQEQDQFVRWLRTLPKPIAVLTFNDECGFQLLDACRRAQLRVPEEVAVLGAGNDTVLCDLTSPPLSSIETMPARIGYEAAAMLDRMMASPRKAVKKTSVVFPPTGVVVRQSSGVTAISDRLVADAVHFIRKQACKPITVEDVLRHVPLSRSVLDLRFKAVLKRTPKAEILRVQLENARRLLAGTNLSLQEIAGQCGFSSAKYLGDAFVRVVGVRPGTYRRQNQKV